jgi:molybdate/tungstate transport system substrate-binding protein
VKYELEPGWSLEIARRFTELDRRADVGRSDPNVDPSGYRTVLTMRLAEQYYPEPGLTGELNYIWTYQNLAENDGLRFVRLPDAIDLGSPADSVLPTGSDVPAMLS